MTASSSASGSGSSASLLNIWARGVPSDQLTPKASAQAGTSTEIDPFDHHHPSTPTSLNNSSPKQSRRSSLASSPLRNQSSASDSHHHNPSLHHLISDDANGLKTPMPSSPRGSKQYFSNHSIESSLTPHTSQPNLSQGLAATALKAIAQHPRPTDFSFTSNPLNHAKNALRGTVAATATTGSKFNSSPRRTSKNSIELSPPGSTSSISRSPLNPNFLPSQTHVETSTMMMDKKALVDAITNVGTIGVPDELLKLGPSPHLSNSTPSPPVPLVSPRLSYSPTSEESVSKEVSKNALAQPPKGLLSVKIISAKALACSSSHSRPYVVAQFDNNEFVSREPIAEDEDESKGVVQNGSRNGGGGSHAHSRSIDIAIYNQSRAKSDSIIGTDGKGPPESNGNGVFCLSGQNPIWKQEVDFDVAEHEHLNSSHRTLHVSVYDRSIGDTISAGPELGQTHLGLPTATATAGVEGVELFLGETEIELNFDQLVKMQKGWFDQWYKLGTQNADSTGEIRIQLKYIELKSKKSLSVQDFEFLKMIGKGTFGRVFQVRKKDTKRIYAMKVLSKKEVIDKKEVEHTIGERNILQQSNSCPFLLGLKFSFQSPGELFLVMDYKSGGELFHHLQKEGRFTEERARFYTAEIVLALEHLHTYNIVYRDLKPENILLDATGHIVLCDFGLSKPNLSSDELTTTFCGTTEYLAPEVLLDDHGYSKLVDFWSLGVLLFEMCCGWSPFYAEDNQQMYKNICFGKIKFPRGVIGDDGKQFVKGLLNRNPKHRLGSQHDTEDLKRHGFFKSIDWTLLESRQIVPSFKPYIDSDDSVVNFDVEFTQLDINQELPMSMRLFDEEDRSADWVTQASSYVNPTPIHLKQPTTTSSGTKPVPMPKEVVNQSKGEDTLQDHFRGFSYHGESEMMTSAAHSKFGMSSIRDLD